MPQIMQQEGWSVSYLSERLKTFFFVIFSCVRTPSTDADFNPYISIENFLDKVFKGIVIDYTHTLS